MQPPIITLAGLHRALSEPRLDSYRQESDWDEVDRVARYVWNMVEQCSQFHASHL
jgi:hypothetical protein